MEKYEFILKNNQKLIIRKACEDDAERFLKYFNSVGGETDFLGFGEEGPRVTLEEEREIFKNSTSKNFFLIAELDKKIVGSCSVSTNEKRLRSFFSFWRIGNSCIKRLLEFGNRI